MKKLTTFFFIILFASVIIAQENKKFELSVGGGLSFPSAPTQFTDYWNTGYNGSVGLGYILDPQVKIGAGLGYHSFSMNTDEFLKDFDLWLPGMTASGGSISVLYLSLNVKGFFSPNSKKVRPYLLGGVGYFSLTADEVEVQYMNIKASGEDESESVFGLNGSAGIEIPAGEIISIFIEAGYCNGFTEENNTAFIYGKGGINIEI